jgi:hypothetical protein
LAKVHGSGGLARIGARAGWCERERKKAGRNSG